MEEEQNNQQQEAVTPETPEVTATPEIEQAKKVCVETESKMNRFKKNMRRYSLRTKMLFITALVAALDTIDRAVELAAEVDSELTAWFARVRARINSFLVSLRASVQAGAKGMKEKVQQVRQDLSADYSQFASDMT